MADVLHIDPDHLKGRWLNRAAEVLRGGGVVIYPTDTIYGFGCDIEVKSAIERIRQLKGRDAKKPMSFICSDLTAISAATPGSPTSRYRILKRFLPGPYTFVLPATRETPRLLRSRQKTVGIRIPDHPLTQGLVRELGSPIISTSANRSEQEVLTDPLELEREFGSRVDLILECGMLPVQPSTVVSLVGDRDRGAAGRPGGRRVLQEAAGG